MSFLTNIIGGEPKNDLEGAVDRAFLNYGISRGVGWLFDPDRRKRELEEKLLERSLTSDDFGSKIASGVKWASVLRSPAKASIAKLLSQ